MSKFDPLQILFLFLFFIVLYQPQWVIEMLYSNSKRQFTFKFLMSLLRADFKEQEFDFNAFLLSPYNFFIFSPLSITLFNEGCLQLGLLSSPLRGLKLQQASYRFYGNHREASWPHQTKVRSLKYLQQKNSGDQRASSAFILQTQSRDQNLAIQQRFSGVLLKKPEYSLSSFSRDTLVFWFGMPGQILGKIIGRQASAQNNVWVARCPIKEIPFSFNEVSVNDRHSPRSVAVLMNTEVCCVACVQNKR